MAAPFSEVWRNVRKVSGIKGPVSAVWRLRCILEVQVRSWVYKSASQWGGGKVEVGILRVSCV